MSVWLWAAAFAQTPPAEPPAPEVPAPEVPVPAPAEPAPAPVDPRDEMFGEPEPAPADPRDALFGDPAPTGSAPPAPAEAPAGSRDEALLGGVYTGSEGALNQKLGQLDERLTIGGRVWLLTQGNVSEDAEDLGDVTLDSPNRLDLYADARPNDRVRAYVSGRLTHDFSVRRGDTNPATGDELSPDTVLLDQLWLKFDVAHRVYVTAGKQRVRWGTGRFWNPSDFLNQQRLDPLAIFDVRTGVDLVKVHVPVEAANANFYAIANLQDAQALDQVGGALRAEWAFGQTELTASGALRKGSAEKLAATVSSGLGPFDLALEGVLQHGPTDTYYEGEFDPLAFQFPEEIDRSEDWLGQVVARVELTLGYGGDDSVSIGVEGFHNAPGYADADLLPWLFLNGAYVPLYFGRDYAGAYVFLPGPGRADDHNFIASVLANVSDGSLVARADWRATVLTWLEPNAFVTWAGGGNGEFHFSYRVPPQPLVPGLEDGIRIPAPLLTVGAGAVVRF
jgi:hypothetical protein